MTETLSMQPAAPETFHFACHKELACVTKCCNDLKLVLKPYRTALKDLEDTQQPASSNV